MKYTVFIDQKIFHPPIASELNLYLAHLQNHTPQSRRLIGGHDFLFRIQVNRTPRPILNSKNRFRVPFSRRISAPPIGVVAVVVDEDKSGPIKRAAAVALISRKLLGWYTYLRTFVFVYKIFQVSNTLVAKW